VGSEVSTAIDLAAIQKELEWLQENPEFEERPATIVEFLGPNYLNCEAQIRVVIKEMLEEIFGEEVSSEALAKYGLAMITGGIGIGKTTIASIVMPYLAHWVLCLKDPQQFFNLLPGSRIAFMQMSTSGKQAMQVIFGDIKARIEHSPWFAKYPYDKKYKTQLRFPKNIWILPGDSAETTFEGYNILGGILDEADSHQVTDDKDYADQGYTTINSRIESRFSSIQRVQADGSTRTFSYGFLLVIGQMKKSNGFAAKKYEEFTARDDAYARRVTIWESYGWDTYLKDDGTRDSFWYDTRRFEIIPAGVAQAMGESQQFLIEIPNKFRNSFLNGPQKALRDLAGIPPTSGSPFIALHFKVTDARDRWLRRYNPDIEDIAYAAITSPMRPDGRLEEWFRAPDPLPRACHLDIAYSAEGDSMGFAMGHVPELAEVDGETKPYIVIDLMMRRHAAPGRELSIADARHLIYHLKDDLGFRIISVTMDGFQSTDTKQQLNRRRIFSEILSIDRSLAPYEDLREALYENRFEMPKYMVRMTDQDVQEVEIGVKELTELVDNGKKIDHPPDGSKDVADCLAGVTSALMGDRTYARNSRTLSMPATSTRPVGTTPAEQGGLPGRFGGAAIPQAPLPPSDALGALWKPGQYR
jgi:hypothetical protein